MKSNLFDELNKVDDEESLIKFLKIVSKDYKDNENEWQNKNISDYFERASEWAEISNKRIAHYEKQDNPWKRMADIVYMGKIYE